MPILQSDSGFANIDFPPVPVPLYNGNPWFLPIVGGYYRLRDKWERGNG